MKHIIKEEKPNPRNIEAAGKFALRLVDHWQKWEETATKLTDETKDPEVWRKIENFKQQVEDFAKKATKLTNDFETKQQFEEVQKHHLDEMIDVDPEKATAEPSRNAALF